MEMDTLHTFSSTSILKSMEMAVDDLQDEQTSSNGSSKWKADPNTEYLTLQTIYATLIADAHWK